MTAHDAGEEMMGDPGSDTYLLPTDANGDALVEPGQPETVPADAVQPPPVDGAIAGTDLAPPESGYDHIPMADGFAMPGPFNIGSVEGKQEDGGREALEDSIGVDGVAAEVPQDGPNQVDVAVGAAIDGATEQGGGVGSGASIGQDFGNNGEGEEGNDTQDVDPSAGMG